MKIYLSEERYAVNEFGNMQKEWHNQILFKTA